MRGAAVGLGQDRPRRLRPRACTSSASSWCRRAAPRRRSPRPGIPVTTLADVTGVPEMLDHRVVTLHPKVHGGILADRGKESHLADLEEHGIAAVRPRRVEPLPVPRVDPTSRRSTSAGRDDARRGEEPRVGRDRHAPRPVRRRARRAARSDGALSDDTRRALALEAFARTAAYDAAIVQWLQDGDDASAAPRARARPHRRAAALRREPAPAGARYRRRGTTSWWDGVTQHSGLALCVPQLLRRRRRVAARARPRRPGPPCAIIKHANPCGVAVADDLATAYQRALECDERSAFGGIVALNRPIDAATVERMVAGPQADVVIAPGYDAGTIEALRKKRKNTRLLEAPAPGAARPRLPPDLRRVPRAGAAPLRGRPRRLARRHQARADRRASGATPSSRGASCGHVKSNAIVLVKDGQAVGIGAGQQNRVESGEIAAKKAAGRAEGGACATDAFYPFPDGIEAAAAAGVAVVIQPGGCDAATRRSSSAPTSSASRWCSPANGTSCTDDERDR